MKSKKNKNNNKQLLFLQSCFRINLNSFIFALLFFICMLNNMSRRFTTKEAKDYLYKYGYIITDKHYKYHNLNQYIHLYDLTTDRNITLTMKQVIYRIENASTKRPEYLVHELDRIMNIGFQPGRTKETREQRIINSFGFLNDIQEQPGQTALPHEAREMLYNIQEQPGKVKDEDKFLDINPISKEYINVKYNQNEAAELKALMKNKLTQYIKTLKHACKNNQTIVFDVNKDNQFDEDAVKQTTLLAIQKLKKQLLAKNVNVLITSTDGSQKRFYLNENSFDLLNSALFMDNIPDINDSNTEILNHYYINSLASIAFEIEPLHKPSRTNPGFFPFVNISNMDLTDYGIYNSAKDPRQLNESCLITAIKNSNVLEQDELNRLQHFITTRTYLLEDLPLLCEEFSINIVLHMVSPNTGKVNLREYNCSNNNNNNNLRTIKLVVMFGHYMVDKKLDLSADSEFKKVTNIVTLINKLISKKLLIPMTDEEMINIIVNFNMNSQVTYNYQRPVTIKIPKQNNNYNSISKAKHSKFFFGYDPDPEEINIRMHEIQSFVNKLPLRNSINVSQYYRYSNLMQRIMYEFGCYDGVYESSGINNMNFRETIKYPRPHSDFQKMPFEINEKLYYIDMNSSYMSFINGIPTDLSMNQRNYSINKLIHMMYNYRKKVKQSHPKLATTIKFLMNSCYGYSLRKAKHYKRKYTTNINNYIDKYSPFIFSIYNTKGNNEGFVNSKASFVPDYNTIQFGADILNNYNNFMEQIRNLVTVYYENIDAILINEADYNKLLALGYIGDKLGQFKIEHIFTRFKYISGRKWQGYYNEQRGKWN